MSRSPETPIHPSTSTSETTPHVHEESPRFYWIMGAILAVLTITEVVFVEFMVEPLGIPFLPALLILLALATVKGALVVMYYMHLKGDRRLYQFVFIAPFCIALSFVLIFLLLFQTRTGIAA